MNVLRELKVRLDLFVGNAGFKKFQGQIDRSLRDVKKLGAVIGGAFLVRRLKDMTKEALYAADALADSADQVGVSTDFLQKWNLAAKVAGVEAGTMRTAMQKFIKTMGEGQIGMGRGVKWLNKFGIGLKNNDGTMKDSTTLLLELADVFKGLPSDAQRAALANTFFTQTGIPFVNVLRKGRAALEAQMKSFEELGAVMDKDAVKVAGDLTDRWDVLGVAVDALIFRLTTAFAPALTSLTGYVEALFKWIQRNNKSINFFKIALIALGGVIAGVGIALLIAFGPWVVIIAAAAAALTTVYLVLEDIYYLFTGGQSAIGAFLSDLVGFDVAEKIFKRLAFVILTTVDAIDAAISGLRILFNLITFDFAEAKQIAGDLASGKRAGMGQRYLAGYNANIQAARAAVTNIAIPTAPAITNAARNTNSQTNNMTFNIAGQNAMDIAQEVRKVLNVEYDFTTTDFTQDIVAE